MATVNTNIRLNTALLRSLDQSKATALVQTAEALKTGVQQAAVMPRDVGTLQNNATTVNGANAANGKVSIVSSTPYARRLYFHPEYNFDRSKNSNAGGKWYDDWLDGQFATEAFIRIYGGSIGI